VAHPDRRFSHAMRENGGFPFTFLVKSCTPDNEAYRPFDQMRSLTWITEFSLIAKSAFASKNEVIFFIAIQIF
jgi:hypothetical protein